MEMKAAAITIRGYSAAEAKYNFASLTVLWECKIIRREVKEKLSSPEKTNPRPIEQ